MHYSTTISARTKRPRQMTPKRAGALRAVILATRPTHSRHLTTVSQSRFPSRRTFSRTAHAPALFIWRLRCLYFYTLLQSLYFFRMTCVSFTPPIAASLHMATVFALKHGLPTLQAPLQPIPYLVPNIPPPLPYPATLPRLVRL